MEIRELQERWRKRVLALAGTFLPAAEAEEVTQDVFLAVWRLLPQYDPERASHWTWLSTITRSRCLDRLRASHRADRFVAQYSGLVHEEGQPPERLLEYGRLRAVLLSLPERQRAVVDLAYFHGLSHREIALLRGEPLGTVKTRLRLALASLSSRMLEDGNAVA